MARTAKEIYKVAKKNQILKKKNDYTSLSDKATLAVTEMMKAGDLITEIDLDDNELDDIVEFTLQLKELGYRHCLIEEQENGNVLGFRLRISIAHLEK